MSLERTRSYSKRVGASEWPRGRVNWGLPPQATMAARTHSVTPPQGRKNAAAARSSSIKRRRDPRTPSDSNPFHLLLKQVRRDVDLRLSALFQRKLTEAEPLGTDVVALVDSLRDLTMRGGKRFRPALRFAAYPA